jgi:type IV secretory pathway protease TraF
MAEGQAADAPTLRTRSRQVNEAVAAGITVVTTSMWFLYGLVLFVGLWMRFAPALHLDRSPSYPVMLYWVNLFQALMLPVLAVGQSVLNRANERRQRHEAEVVDRLDHLARRILALEEAHAALRRTREAHHEAVMRRLEGIAGHLQVPPAGPATG